MTREEIEARIGPIRRTLEPDNVGLGCLLLAGALGVVFLALCSLSALAGVLTADNFGGVAVVVGFGPLFALVLVGLPQWLITGSNERLHVGERGLVEVRGNEAEVLLWDDLGTVWRAIPRELDTDARVPILLLLERGDGARFRLRDRYAGVGAVRKLIGQYLRRRVVTLRVAAADERLTEERPDPGVRGPWTGTAVEAEIGPIRRVCAPTETAAALFRHRINVGFGIGLCFGLLFLVGSIGLWVLAYLTDLVLLLPLGLCLLFVALPTLGMAFSIRTHWLEPLRSVLLVGARGLATWHPDEARLLVFEDIGPTWRRDPDITAADRSGAIVPILLKLQHLDGPVWFVTELYEHVAEVAGRIRAELDSLRPAERPTRPRGPAPTSIRAPGRYSETRALPVLAAERPATPDPVEFICGTSAVSRPSYLFPMLVTLALILLSTLSCGLLIWAAIAFAGILTQLGVGHFPAARWLVGPGTLTYQHGPRTEVLRWDDLGLTWRAYFLPRLVILLADGTELPVPPEYPNAARLEERVRAAVHRGGRSEALRSEEAP